MLATLGLVLLTKSVFIREMILNRLQKCTHTQTLLTYCLPVEAAARYMRVHQQCDNSSEKQQAERNTVGRAAA